MEQNIALTKLKLEELGYKDVRTFDQPVILLNGKAMKARVCHFEDEDALKAELDPQCPILMMDMQPTGSARFGYTIRLFK